MIRHLLFFISEAIIGMKRSGLMILIAVGTITVSLIIFGLFLLINMNFTHLANYMSSRLELRVFLKPELTTGQLNSFQAILKEMNDVENVQFIDRHFAWRQFTQSYKHLNLKEMLNNPLPHSFKVLLTDNQYIFDRSEQIRSYTDYVAEVKNGGVVAERMYAFTKWIRYSGTLLVVFLTVATLFIIVNTIRLTVINRQDEISIMKLVGATNPFISGPFLIEGVLIGITGGIGSIVVLKGIYTVLGKKLQEGIPFMPLVFETYMLNQIYLFLLISGIILGVLGAYISVSKSLKLTL